MFPSSPSLDTPLPPSLTNALPIGAHNLTTLSIPLVASRSSCGCACRQRDRHQSQQGGTSRCAITLRLKLSRRAHTLGFKLLTWKYDTLGIGAKTCGSWCGGATLEGGPDLMAWTMYAADVGICIGGGGGNLVAWTTSVVDDVSCG